MIKQLFLLLFLNTLTAVAQTPMVDRLISEGHSLAQLGKQSEALLKYERALSLNPKNTEARYELAYSYYVLEEYKKAIEHARTVTTHQSDNYEPDALIIIGASYENLGKNKLAITTYTQALAKYPLHPQLNYNAALSHFNAKNYSTAEYLLTICIKNDKGNRSAHLLLANTEFALGEKVKCMMALYYFLLIEHDTERTLKAFDMLETIWQHIDKSIQNPIQTKIIKSSSPFRNIESSLTTLVIDTTNNTPVNCFAQQTEGFMNTIATDIPKQYDFWGEVYLNFYTQIAQKKYSTILAYFTAQSKYKDEAIVGLTKNNVKFNEFTNWMLTQ